MPTPRTSVREQRRILLNAFKRGAIDAHTYYHQCARLEMSNPEPRLRTPAYPNLFTRR